MTFEEFCDKNKFYLIKLKNRLSNIYRNQKSPEEIEQIVILSAYDTIEALKDREIYQNPLGYFFSCLRKNLNKEKFKEKFVSYDWSSDTDPKNPIKEFDINHDITLVVSKLSEIQQTVIKHRYYDNMTLAESGMALNLSAERIRQIEEAALDKLRWELTRDTNSKVIKKSNLSV